MSIEIEGLNEILTKLEKLSNTQTLDAAIGKACAVVEAEAKKKAPKDSGALRRSISSRVEDGRGIVYTPLEYAPYVEYGTGLFAESGGRSNVPWVYVDDEGKGHTTSGQKPQPYMRPALYESREKVLRVIREGIISND